MTMRLAIDAMGGDKGPEVIFPAISYYLKHYMDGAVHLSLYGRKEVLDPFLVGFKIPKNATLTVIDCPDIVENNTKPSFAIRRLRESSMAKAVKSVSDGENDAVVSAGNTGALMAFTKVFLKTCDEIDRPAIPAIIPSMKGDIVMLDVGANVDCSPEMLVQFARMGAAYAKQILNKTNCKVGLLNIGEEDHKGNSNLKVAHQLLKETDLNYLGFVEGDDINKGTVDIIVTDGFSGNIALKTIEGAAQLFYYALKDSLTANALAKIGGMFAYPALSSFRDKFDPRLYNGAVFLGVKKVAVKSHGGADAFGFSNAMKVAVDMARKNLSYHIEQSLITG